MPEATKKEGPGTSQPNPLNDAAIYDFIYHAEGAKLEFQACISSLLELHALVNARLAKARENNREGVYFHDNELQVILGWIMQVSTDLLEHYASIDRVNRKTNALYKTAQRINEVKSRLHLKDLVA